MWTQFSAFYLAITLHFTWLFAPSVPPPETPVRSTYIYTIPVLSFSLFVWCFQTFLVRKCSSSQRKVLCLRVTADKSASSVKECFICEEDSSEYKTSHISMFYPHLTLLLSARRLWCAAVQTLTGWSGVGQRGGPYTLLAAAIFTDLIKLCVFCNQRSPWRAQHSPSLTCVDWWPSTVSAGDVLFWYTTRPKVCGQFVFHGFPL